MLEIVRHVNLGHELIRPMTERVAGKRMIGAYFENNPDKEALARAARELMQNEAAEGRSYTAVGGRWIESSLLPPPARDPLPEPAPATTLETRVNDLQAQLVLLVALHEGLLSRLARVEAKLLEPGAAAAAHAAPQQMTPVPAAPRPPAPAPVGAVLDAAEALVAPVAAQHGGAVPERGPHSPRPSQPAREASSLPPTSSSVAQPEAAPDELERLELQLPPVADLARCISLLIGGDVSVQAGSALPLNRTTRDCYAAAILDGSDRSVGLVVMDLKAAVFLGGTLMMLPRTELDQQLASASPGEDSIAAAAEICNALAGAVSGAQARQVRAGNLEKFDFRRASWVTDPADRRDLEDSFGGRTAVLARRVAPPVG